MKKPTHKQTTDDFPPLAFDSPLEPVLLASPLPPSDQERRGSSLSAEQQWKEARDRYVLSQLEDEEEAPLRAPDELTAARLRLLQVLQAKVGRDALAAPGLPWVTFYDQLCPGKREKLPVALAEKNPPPLIDALSAQTLEARVLMSILEDALGADSLSAADRRARVRAQRKAHRQWIAPYIKKARDREHKAKHVAVQRLWKQYRQTLEQQRANTTPFQDIAFKEVVRGFLDNPQKMSPRRRKAALVEFATALYTECPALEERTVAWLLTQLADLSSQADLLARRDDETPEFWEEVARRQQRLKKG